MLQMHQPHAVSHLGGNPAALDTTTPVLHNDLIGLQDGFIRSAAQPVGA